jgi:hypothetical protein
MGHEYVGIVEEVGRDLSTGHNAMPTMREQVADVLGSIA